jgi:hypothetical protein
MPIPKPKEGEQEQDYISRCARAIADEYPDNAQRIAVCYSQLKEKMSKDELFVLQPKKNENRGNYLSRCSKNGKMRGQFPNMKERMGYCLNSFNSYYKYWAKMEEFGEIPKDSALGMCIAKKKAQGVDYKQAYRECASKVVVPSGPIVLAEDLNIYGVRPKHFDICPVAVELFKHFIDMGLNEETIGMVRSAALVADRVFEIEKEAIEEEYVDEDMLIEAIALVEDFKDIIHEVDEETGMVHDVSFMDGHIEKIKTYVDMEDDLLIEPVEY